MKKEKLLSLLLPVIAVMGLIVFNALKSDVPTKHKIVADNAGLTLPDGFSAAMIIDHLPGGAREMAPTPEGDLYVKIYHTTQRRAFVSKGIVELHVDGDKATVKTSFGSFAGSG